MKKLYAFFVLGFLYTQINAQCPIINGAFVNSCSPVANTEGLNEFVVFTTTAPAAVSNYVLSYGSVTPPATNTPTGILSGQNARTINGTGSITAVGGCVIIYVTSPATVLPAGVQVVFIPSNFTNSFDVSPFCTAGNTVYVVPIDITAAPSKWAASGVLENNPGSTQRYLQVSGGAFSCTITIRSYTSGWPADLDGNFVVWDLPGNATYLNGGCDLVTTPVKLVSFAATGLGKDASIVWQTASEVNTRLFELERSLDGRKFEVISSMPAAGNSSVTKSYSFKDLNIPTGVSFYRLKTIDFDGAVSYSSIAKVTSTNNNLVITNIFPRPAISELGISWNAPRPGPTAASIFDFSGRLMQTFSLATAAGMNHKRIPVSNLPKGEYLLKLVKDDEVVMGRFTRQ